MRLTLPLRDGAYYVVHGVDSRLLNYPTQRYALDIMQVNELGVRASRMYSADLQRYVIFGAHVYSPCDGQERSIRL